MPSADAPKRVDAVFLGEPPDPARMAPLSMEPSSADRARPPDKPHGGLWTCRYQPADPELGFAWVRWCERFRWSPDPQAPIRLWRLSAPHPKLLVIDSQATFDAIRREYPHSWMPPAMQQPPSLAGVFAEIDYVAVAAAGYDAVELTPTGLDDLRDGWPPRLVTWDVPSILWLAWCFDRVEPFWRPIDVVRR